MAEGLTGLLMAEHKFRVWLREENRSSFTQGLLKHVDEFGAYAKGCGRHVSLSRRET